MDKESLHLLDFQMPEFTRISWVSDRAKEVWEPRRERINRAWKELQWRSVADGLRRCAVLMVQPYEFIEQAGSWAKANLAALPVAIEGASEDGSYASHRIPTRLGDPIVFRLVLGSPQDIVEFQEAFEAGDDWHIGRLLGYPACCCEFFKDTWVHQGLVDTTWPMAVNTHDSSLEGTTITVSGPAESNILWRWMGVRSVAHLPCSFRCEATVQLGTEYMLLGERAGHGDEMEWMHEILSWPTEWSMLHGIAEIKTPILKVSARTDATAVKYTVRRTADAGCYPKEGATGLRFPYSPPPSERQCSRLAQQGERELITLDAAPADSYSVDNGFESVGAMKRCHVPIIALAIEILAGRGGNVLDLGCGNGALLKGIRERNSAIVPYGIDIDPLKIRHARELHSDCNENFVVGDIFNDELWRQWKPFALGIVMPGRLLEASADQAARLMLALTQHCESILIYAYVEWLIHHGTLTELAQRTGLELAKVTAGAKSAAGLVVARDPAAQGHTVGDGPKEGLIGRRTGGRRWTKTPEQN